MKVTEAIARVLKAEGIEFLVCYPRQLLIDACTEVGIRPIICRQERVGAGIADGISRSTNGARIGVFAMQGGPGVENSFAGVAQLFADNVPVLILPAGQATGRRYTPPTFSAVDNFAHITKFAAELNQPRRVGELMRRAFQQLRSGKPGPVLLELPGDISEAELEGELDYTPVKPLRTGPDPAEVRTMAELLLAAKCPVIHAGQGILYAGASAELVKLAELIDAPVLTTNTGKSAFPEDHPLSLGGSAISAPKAAFHFLRQADPIVGIGTSFSRTPWGPQIPAGKTILHMTNDPGDINKEFATRAALLGDAKLVLEALIAEIGPRRRRTGMASQVRALKEEWQKEWAPELTSSEVPINQYRIIHDLIGAVDPANTIATHDSGSPREQVVPFWPCVTPRGYLGWGKSTQLGHGLGLIMGAKLAHPDKLCVNFMGDAAMGQVGMDLETAVRNRIGILTIVFNNGVMAGERASMPKSIEKHHALDLGGNYCEVAKGLGGWATRIERAEAFLPALREALEVTRANHPALIECVAKQCYHFSRY
ncbi:MAG TPA: thiamine pyrophosphate-requiring protein [Candidatus Binataceae bacterium]|nr:thiamine pyrophosphate-requiring protein [Candidatus Binataceae bacterium]